MKAYSLALREKIVTPYLVGKMSIRKVATQFGVTKSLVQKLVKQKLSIRKYRTNALFFTVPFFPQQ